LDIRRGGLGDVKLASFFDLPNGRLVRKSQFRGDRQAMLYIVAVSNAEQAIEIIRTKAAGPNEHVEDLGRVTGFLVQAFHLGRGEFIRIDGKHQAHGKVQLNSARIE
jgi:hypothetical protein